ncbi:unnamed protein product [Pseudo-nitzschia multistriata]|uniref:Gamma-glutamyltransferase n=1 Tax=Pseudo-nitzschia multistriata TaxID=183589 RepID=A0A448ZMV2_9STRA|nr:unnamed protein product [Pseudo-nitzschia multistriata]
MAHSSKSILRRSKSESSDNNSEIPGPRESAASPPPSACRSSFEDTLASSCKFGPSSTENECSPLIIVSKLDSVSAERSRNTNDYDLYNIAMEDANSPGAQQHQLHMHTISTVGVDYDDEDEDDLIQNDGRSRSYTICNHRCQHPQYCLTTLLLIASLVLFVSSLVILGISYHYYSIVSSPKAVSNNNIIINSHGGGFDEEREAALKGILSSKASLNNLSNGAVASDHPVCSKVGADILSKKGGNAVDAAVATVLCLGVANPASSGLGGGAFILIRSSKTHFESKQKQQHTRNSSSTLLTPVFDDARDYTITNNEDPNFVTEVVDCRETAPEKASRDMYTGLPRQASFAGGLAIPIPGELRGLELAHFRHGRLTWSEVVEPARLLARDGVLVGSHLSADIKGLFTRSFPWLGEYEDNFLAIRKYLSSSNSTEYLREGELLRNPSLAKLLQEVAEQGADALYKGKNAELLVRDIQDSGGIVTVKDLETYRATLRTPIRATVSGYSIVGVPPPSSGGAVIIGIARFLSGYPRPFASASETLSVHRMAEAMKHAFSIRMSMSDPAYNGNVTQDAVRDLTSNGYMESLRRITSDKTTLGLSHYGGPKWSLMRDDDGTKEVVDAHEGDRREIRHLLSDDQQRTKPSTLPEIAVGTGGIHAKSRSIQNRKMSQRFGYLEDNGTSHLSVVDKDGNAVAVTTSINGIFGSIVFSESTGIMLGNTMDDFGVPGAPNHFGLRPSESNFVAPGKRPLSSMSPTMVFRRTNRSDVITASDNKWENLAMVLGGSGGPKIITAVIQVFLNVFFLGMPLFDAIARPRVHDQLLYHESVVTTTERAILKGGTKSNYTEITIDVPQRTKDALLKRGHKLIDIDYTGCVQSILVDPDTNTLSAVSDVRKGGSPAGY